MRNHLYKRLCGVFLTLNFTPNCLGHIIYLVFYFSFPCLSESHWQARRMYVVERKINPESHYRANKKKKRKIYLVKTVKMKTRIIHWRIPGKLWLTRTEGWNLLLVYYSNTVIVYKNVTVLKHIMQFLLENSYDSLQMLMVAFFDWFDCCDFKHADHLLNIYW